MEPEPRAHTAAACTRLLDALVPGPPEMLAALAPEGWMHSPLVRALHPTAQQQYEGAVAFHEGSAWLRTRPEDEEPPPRLEDFEEPDLSQIDPEVDVVWVVGMCLWDVFSDNHEVFDAEGTVYDLGSFRGAAGFLAGHFDRHRPPGEGRWHYLDFYLGTMHGLECVDLTPVYTWIFRGLKAQGCDWAYSFPRLYLVPVPPAEPEDDPASYDPARAVQDEMEHAEQEEDYAGLEADLDALHRETVEAARDRPPPAIVTAYRAVYGRFPKGWPPA